METTISKLTPSEKSRTYVYANGVRDTLENVVALGVSPRGTHRLETADGKKHIVPPGWIRIELDVDSWTL